MESVADAFLFMHFYFWVFSFVVLLIYLSITSPSFYIAIIEEIAWYS